MMPHAKSRLSSAARIVIVWLGLFLLCDAAIGLSIWLPYYREQQVIDQIRDCGGKVRSESFDSFGLRTYLTARQGKVFGRVTEVWGSNSAMTDADVQRLAELKKLKRLSLSQTPISDRALAQIGRMHALESLYIDGAQISDSGLAHLCGLTKLKRLSLTHMPVTEKGLAQLRVLKDLELLWLKRTQVSSAGLAALQADLPDCQITR